MIIFYSARCLEYEWPHHPESPARVLAAVQRLQENKAAKALSAGADSSLRNLEWLEPIAAGEADILRVHSREQLEAVRAGGYQDADTPWSPAIYEHALLAAGSACNAAEAAMNGRSAFSLMRPPGHHAERDRVMGFCYFNNIAIAVAKVLEQSQTLNAQRSTLNIQRVAIVDFDCHHGNGTEDIFLGDERVLYVSLHQSPCYPGTGLQSQKNCRNYPLPPGTDGETYLEAFDQALKEIRQFQPQLIAVSAGFDAHEADPITQMELEVETFGKIGERIAELGLPTFGVLEGGYGARFAVCVEAFLGGLESI